MNAVLFIILLAINNLGIAVFVYWLIKYIRTRQIKSLVMCASLFLLTLFSYLYSFLQYFSEWLVEPLSRFLFTTLLSMCVLSFFLCIFVFINFYREIKNKIVNKFIIPGLAAVNIVSMLLLYPFYPGTELKTIFTILFLFSLVSIFILSVIDFFKVKDRIIHKFRVLVYINPVYIFIFLGLSLIQEVIFFSYIFDSIGYSWILTAFFILWSIVTVISFKDPETKTETKKSEEFYLEAFDLTDTEQIIARYILEAKSNKEIAYELKISDSTVKNHVYNMYNKLNINSRVQFINLVRESQLN